jgi:hypothetical protein
VSFPGPGTPDGPLQESRDAEVFAVPDMARRAFRGLADAGVDLLTVDAHPRRRLEAQANPTAFHRDDGHLDAAADADGLARLSGEDEHEGLLLEQGG